MTILSDLGIQDALASGALLIQPVLTPGEMHNRLQPASLDLTLGREFALYPYDALCPVTDPLDPPRMQTVQLLDGETYTLRPNGFVLATTAEAITLGRNLAGQVDGRSTLGRLGLSIHATAGFIDPGFSGQITLELFNAAPRPILLRPGMGIAQLLLHTLSTTPARAYGDVGLGSRYQGSVGVVPARRLWSRYEVIDS